MKKRKTIIEFLSLLVGLLVFSCANPITPSGGPKDFVPPKVTIASPPNKSVNSKPQKIEIQFDEYFVLDNPTQNITVSPPLKNMPEFLVKGKTLQIKINDEPFLENTTYTINFGNAIKDNNEGNLQDSFVYVFSTGAYLDSFSFQGTIKDAKTGEAEEGFLLGLYTDLNDSVVFKNKPVYYTKTRKDGSFKLENLKGGNYKVFAFKDDNFNFIKDLSSEKIAFLNNPVEVIETTIPVQLFSYKEKQPVKVAADNTKNMGFMQLIFSEPVNTFSVSSTAIADTTHYYNTTKDTVLLFYSSVSKKTDTLFVIANDAPADTIMFSAKTLNRDSIIQMLPPLTIFTPLASGNKRNLPTSTNNQVKQHDYNEPFSIKLNRPIKNIDTNRIVLLEDSIKNAVPFRIEKKDALTYLFHVERAEKIKEGVQYELVINDSALTDYYELVNKKFVQSYKTTTKDNFGDITVIIDSINIDKQYIMQLFNENGSIIEQTIISNLATFKKSYPKQKTGNYKLNVIEDDNRNGKWDSGNYLQKIQPETILVFPEKIEVRGKWENEVIFKINNTSKKKGILDNKTLTD